MPYYIDLSSISLDEYKTKLVARGMIPSRMILKEKLDERFNYFKSIGIKNVQELLQTLRKKDTLAELSKIDCFTGDYLVILLRELNSIHPRPNKIKEFIGISAEVVSKLEKTGIKDTAKLYDKVRTKKSRKELASITGINEPDILELTKLTDLSRIKWASSTFARMLYDIGIDNPEKVSEADYAELHKKIIQINKERNYFKGQIGLNDMKLFVEAAKEILLEVEY
jgi:hypothetical protein